MIQTLEGYPDIMQFPYKRYRIGNPKPGEVPENWRRTNAMLTFKKGRKENLGSYRPISLSSIVGKVLEQLILEIISRHERQKVDWE